MSRNAINTQIHENFMTENAAETSKNNNNWKKSDKFSFSDWIKNMLSYCKSWALNDDHENDAIATERRHYIYMNRSDYERFIVLGHII